MPLIDLKTDLKSLKYGHDTPGGGNSGQPYIQTAIPESRTTPFTSGLIKSSLTDTKRIFKFLKDTPQGPLFIIKQVGLQLSNPRLEVKKINSVGGFFSSLISGDLSSLTGGLLQPTRLYNLGINTLAQIPVSGFGGHLNRHGLFPIQDDNTKYLAVAQANNEDSKNNRLVGYKTKFRLGDGKSENIKNEPLSKLLGFISKFLPIKFASKNLTIDNYLGGPGSSFGIGTTLIRRYDNTETRDGNKQVPQERGKVNYPSLLGVSKLYFAGTGLFSGIFPDRDTAAKNGMDLSNPTKTPAQLNQTAVNYTNPSIKKYANLRKQVDSQSIGSIFKFNDGKNTTTGLSLFKDDYNGVVNSYTDKTISYSNGIDKPIVIKGSWKTMNRETRIGSGRQDEINLTPLFYSPSKPGNAVFIQGKEYKTRDLIKFRIGAIDTDAPANTTWMVFRAYLTGFQDSFNAEWSDIKYIGRGEKFKLYNGFDRSVTFNFKVAALSAKEIEPMYQKLNYLA